jgi:activator of 2-hydroxyglutaryl-CoA dehydratase/predicted nucleotide-binding protein (sugar kinase/HSP70/actin superfamily)
MSNLSATGKESYIGFDIGSESVHYAVLDRNAKVIYSPKPIKHFANPIKALGEAWKDAAARLGGHDIKNTAFTGSGALFIKNLMTVTYDYDSVAIPSGAAVIAPDAQYIFHIGAKDSYFFHIQRIENKPVIVECRFSSKCGGGSGTLLAKQCKRLLEAEAGRGLNADKTDINDYYESIYKLAEEKAMQAGTPSEFLARCGIVIQSDLIHKQNEGVGKADNLAGLFRTIARNFRIDVLGNRVLEKTYAVGTGGVFNNELIRKDMEQILNLSITRPEHFENIAAIGAARKGMESEICNVININELENIVEQGKNRRSFAPSLVSHLEKVHEAAITVNSVIHADTEVVIGIDGGSTTTKCAMVSLDGTLLDKLYIKTNGDPENSLKEILRYLNRHRDKVVVCGIGVTGSARTLYEKLLLSRIKAEQMRTEGVTPADRVTDEITCHAMGVKHYDKDVDTIFEIGGQDMKYTIFHKDGSVRDAKMNFSCQAGCGQTLENMADLIGLDVKTTLQEYALRASRIPIIDSTCGVFMEMDEMRLISEGFSKEEIAAAIIRGTAASYYNKFVGGAQHTGSKCSAQGGPALGRAFLAALAQVADKDIYGYPHREIFGAWGAALDVIRHILDMKQNRVAFGTAFRGWDLIDMEFCKSRRKCKDMVEASCDMRDCVLDVFDIDGEVILSGGFCPKGNSENRRKPKPNYVEVFHSVFNKHFRKYGCLLEDMKETASDRTVGIRRATSTITEKGIWSAALLADLGFTPVISPVSNPSIAQMGVDHSRTDFCIARKLVTGHSMLLLNHPGIRYLFNPSFVEYFQKDSHSLKYCIYTASEAYILNDDLMISPSRQISPVLQFGQERILVDNLRREMIAKGFTYSRGRIQKAIACADQAEKAFAAELGRIGELFMERTRDRIAYVGIGRDYVLLDPEASSYAGAMFSQVRGLEYIPQIFLKHRFGPLEQSQLDVEYWCESIDILRAHQYAIGQMNLYPIRLMNFGCGPDSVKLYHEERIQAAAGKPMLVLLTDAQTNNAPFVTRTEAFERVVSQHYQSRETLNEHKHRIQSYRGSNVADTVYGNQQPHGSGVSSPF